MGQNYSPRIKCPFFVCLIVLNEFHRDHKRKDMSKSHGSIVYIKHVAREILQFPVPSFIFTWSLIM